MNEVDEKSSTFLFTVQVGMAGRAFAARAKNANESANADWIKQLSKGLLLFIIKLGISQRHSLGVIRGEGVAPTLENWSEADDFLFAFFCV